MLPDMMLVAAGMAMAFKLRREPRCALTWFGDGSTSRGDFHEAMNWAGVQHLPVIFILENNQFAYSTPIKQQFAVNPVERAAGYGFPGVSVDGNDAEAVFEATRVARERAISGGGPTLIEAVTMRMHGHGAHDDMKYVPKALVEEWRQKDPIDRQSARVAALGVDVEALRAEVRAEVDAAAKQALAGPDARSGDGDRPPLCIRARPRRSCWRTGRRRGAGSGSRHERDDLPARDLRRAAHGDARRRARPAHGRGHRRLRRRLQGDRRLHRGVRRRSRHGHAAGGVRDRRHRGRSGRRRTAPGLRDAVRRLRLLRLRPDHQRRRQDALPPGPAGEHHRPPAERWRLLAVVRFTPRTPRPGSCTRRA